jgi:hypothetical protein
VHTAPHGKWPLETMHTSSQDEQRTSKTRGYGCKVSYLSVRQILILFTTLKPDPLQHILHFKEISLNVVQCLDKNTYDVSEAGPVSVFRYNKGYLFCGAC